MLDAKVALLAEIDRLTDPAVVVASSTSGLLMTDMAVECRHPERFLVGHPFNPPYLIPLVEVVGGRQTDPDAVSWAEAFYTAAGKTSLTMEQEVPGFVGNRLQEALWREALHMVNSGAGDGAADRRLDRARPRPALGDHGADPDLPPRRRSRRHGAHARPLRSGPAGAVDPARGAGPDPGAPRPRRRGGDGGGRRATVAELAQRRDAFLVDLLLLLERHRNGHG